MGTQAEELLREGRLEDALAKLQDQIRDDPAKVELRVFLFQLLAVLGRWDRAMTQLNVAAEMDAEKLLLAEICRPALNSEALRGEIFAGRRTPLVFGEPEEWMGWLIEANRLAAEGQYDAAKQLRDKAFEQSPAIGGTIDGKPFEWIADADGRLGPVLEAIVNGRYFWIPFARIRQVSIEAPAALRNTIWAQAQFTWTNGGTSPGLIPARYAGSESSPDSMIRLARRTAWTEKPGGLFLGLGQRMLATDGGEYSLLEVRRIALDQPAPEAPAAEAQAPGPGISVDLSVEVEPPAPEARPPGG